MPGFEDSVDNLARTFLESDMVFADGGYRQLGTMSGDIAAGLTVELVVQV